MPDIDIDFSDRTQALKLVKHVVASRLDDKNLVKHNTGVYLHEMPVDPKTSLSAITYQDAEAAGCFKIDFLNVSIYNDVRSEEHLVTLMNTEPLWDLLEQTDFVDLLFHVNGHSDILRAMKPVTVEQLAAVLAIIRPAKRHLIGKDWNVVLADVWTKPESDEYYFKKSHAIAYATAIVVQMNLICEKISYGYS
jgi:DNA polymerase III alpha subunit